MNPIQLEDFSNFQFLSGVQLSEDKRTAAFVVKKADLENNSYCSNIWLCDVSSGTVRQLTAMKNESRFLWLDNSTILFPSAREKKDKESLPGIEETVYYRIRIDGGEGVRAFSVPLAVDEIEALEDGRFLLSASFDHNKPDFRSLEGSAKEEAEKQWKEEQDYQVLDEIPYWENGGGFTNKKRTRLWLFHPTDGKPIPITEPMMHVNYFHWERESGKVLYIGTSFSDRMPISSGLFRYDPQNGNTETLVPQGHYAIELAYHQGDRVVMMASEGKRCGINENPCLFRVETDGAVSLLQDADLSYYSAVGSDSRLGGGKSWVAENGGMTFIVTDRNCSRLISIEPDGAFSFLTKPEGSVDCFDRKGDVCLMVAMRGQDLQELYSVDLVSGTEHKLTAFNEGVFDGKYRAVPQPLSFVNKDGVDIDGWVMLPKDYDPSKRYPAILDIHGGPKTVYGTVYYHEMQLWVGQGYFVFFSNPRGGDGRGNAFSDIRGKYGTTDYRDLMEFTDQVLAAYPAIDSSRLGVTGGSYGGFMTNWVIGHTDRFAAAASQRSIANWISMSYTTDIGYYFGPDQTGATAWDGMERMWEQSPLKYADRCKTPTLFIHSDEDYRCWMAEGLQMYTALKVHGVESRLCLFKGENHELSRSGKPKHRIRRLREITNWFDRFLNP